MAVKVKFRCPHCEKKEVSIEFESKDRVIRKIKGGDAEPLMVQVGEHEYRQDIDVGLAVYCKCGRAFFLYELDRNLSNPTIEPALREGHLLAQYCSKCEIAFINPTMQCPQCNHQY